MAFLCRPKTIPSVFDRLFGEEPGGVAVQRARLAKRRSVLDAVFDDAKSLRLRSARTIERSSTSICTRFATLNSAPPGSTRGWTCRR